MANRLWHNVRTRRRNTRCVHGKFQTNGAGATSGPIGAGFSVARTGVGAFEITLHDSYVDLEAAVVCPNVSPAVDLHAQIVSYTAATKKVALRILNAAAPTDFTGGIAFALYFKDAA